MNRRTTRWAHLAIASSAVAFFVGCDNSENAYLDQQSSALAVRMAGGSGDEVAKELGNAVDGSLPVNIQANQLLGESRLSDARHLASQLLAKQSEAEAIVSRVNSLASLANIASTVSNAYRQQEPSASIALVKELSAKVRGDGNTEKFSDLPNGSIPTLAAVKQEKSRLEGELTKAQGDLEAAKSQRDTLLAQVGTLSAKADEQTGQTRLDTVTQAAGQRQQAAVISRNISDLEARISVLNADLSVQKALETNLEAALQSFDAQQQALTTGWKATEEKINQQGKLAGSFVSDSGGDESQASVASLASELNAVLKDADELRDQALSAFSDSVSKFTAAETSANSIRSTLSDSSGKASAEGPALNSLASTLNAERFNLQKAIALREQAAVHAAHARLLLSMAGAALSLEGLPQTLNAATPDPFNSEKLKAAATEAVKSADQLLLEAKDKIDGVALTDENLSALRSLKTSTGIFVNYDRALLSGLASAAKLDAEVAKENAYKDSIQAAKDMIVSAREASIVVPNVPADIYVEPPTPVEEKPADSATAQADADSPAVVELRQALRDMVAQAETANDDPSALDGIVARIKADDVTAPLVTSVREMIELQLKVQTAVKNKWGDEAVAELKKLSTEGGSGEMDPAALNKQIDSMKFTAVDDTHIESPLPLPGNPVSLKFVKEEDVWKLDLTGMPEGLKVVLGAAQGVLQPMKDKLTQLAADIDAGKYENVESVKTAIKEMMPKGPGGEAAPTTDAGEVRPADPAMPEEQLMPPAENPPADPPANP